MAIWSLVIMLRAAVLSRARTMVRVSPTMVVTRMISALLASGDMPTGQTVQLNGAAGKLAPVPAANTRVVPESAGTGAVRTWL